MLDRSNGLAYLVLVPQFHQFWKLTNRPLHAIQSFYDHQDLLPRAAGSWLSLGNGLSDDLLQMTDIVVFEKTNSGT